MEKVGRMRLLCQAPESRKRWAGGEQGVVINTGGSHLTIPAAIAKAGSLHSALLRLCTLTDCHFATPSKLAPGVGASHPALVALLRVAVGAGATFPNQAPQEA